MADYSTTDTESDLGLDDITEKMIKIKNLELEKESISKKSREIEHILKTKTKEFDLQLEILKRKNLSLEELLENYNNNKTNSISENKSEKNCQIEMLENTIHDLESKISLIDQTVMDLERKNQQLNMEISEKKLEINKLSINNIRNEIDDKNIKADIESIDTSAYDNLSQEIKELLLEKDSIIQQEKDKYNEYENQVFDLITEEILNHSKENIRLQEELDLLKEKYREEKNNLFAKIKDFEKIIEENENDPSRKRKSVLNLNNKNFNNQENDDDEAQSFDTTEVEQLLDQLKEVEMKYEDIKFEYETKTDEWNYERERNKNNYIEMENLLNSKISEISKENHALLKEIQEIEMQKYKINSDNDKILFQEIENFQHKIRELEEQREKTEIYYKEKFKVINEEMKELEDSKNSLVLAKEHLSKELNNYQKASLKKEKEIQEKSRIELNYKENENKILKERIETFSRENDLIKKDYDICKKNFERLKSELDNFIEKNQKSKENSKKEIEKLKESAEKLRNHKDLEISQLKKQINDLKEKAAEIDLLIRNNLEKDSLSDLLDNNSGKEIDKYKTQVFSLENNIFMLNEIIEDLKIKLNSKNNLESQIEFSKTEILQLKTNIKNLKEMYETQIVSFQQKLLVSNSDLLSQKRRTTRTTSIMGEGSLNPKQLAILVELESTIKRLNSENKYLKDQLEINSMEVEKIKNLRESDISYFKRELADAEKTVVEAKIEVATLAFDKDCEIIKYKNMCKKLKMKMVTQTSIINNKQQNVVKK